MIDWLMQFIAQVCVQNMYKKNCNTYKHFPGNFQNKLLCHWFNPFMASCIYIQFVSLSSSHGQNLFCKAHFIITPNSKGLMLWTLLSHFILQQASLRLLSYTCLCVLLVCTELPFFPPKSQNQTHPKISLFFSFKQV